MRALELDPDGVWVNTNLALAELFLGHEEAAKEIYLSFKDKPFPGDQTGRTFREVFLADMDELASKGITAPAFEKAKKWLQ